MPDSAFQGLFDHLGIAAGYRHAAGHWVTTPASVRRRLAASLGAPVDTPAEARAALERLKAEESGPLPPVLVWTAGAAPCPLPVVCIKGPLVAEITHEDGSHSEHPLDPAAPGLVPPAPGYHRLRLRAPGLAAETRLIVVPPRCHWPAALDAARIWGLAVQVHALRDIRGGGMGDFHSLQGAIDAAASLGADTVGLNPLHALFPTRPERRSPYAPSSRRFLNPLYIAVELVPESDGLPITPLPNQSGPPRRRDVAALIDNRGVARHRLDVLEALFEAFATRHLDQETPRGRAFAAFRSERGAALEDFARFQVLSELFEDRGLPPAWQQWPAAYRDPRGPAVRSLAQSHARRVTFHAWLQFEADRQLAACATRAQAGGLRLGLYADLAVGVDRDGVDSWVFRDLLAQDISAGCPPDLRNPLGQDWGVAPFHPRALKAAAYQPFIDTLRAVMRHAGALRIDHAFQLTRLFWRPLDLPPGEGGYVAYPLADLLGIIALESQRAHCAVIAEDLGTIPDDFREAAMARGTLSYRILHRERGQGRSYLPPESYPAEAAVAAGTHDQATLAGFWTGHDVASRRELGLYPTDAAAAAAGPQRAEDRRQLVAALTAAGLLDPATDPEGPLPEGLAAAVAGFLGRTPARLVMIQPEDVIGQVAQVNMPATVDAYPNWRRRLAVPVEEWADDARFQAVAEALRARRGYLGSLCDPR
ncbi:4-alpha-glucanotransferase [Roseospirillum parvum]|uniref:4-alpha-glucanotransferase n=1 Tax=Roseospirillum parvum TaxID=83401 RepID=A0A1G7TM04_9PROT|nr:4-alpha-glucanotransferase [Roseospirillum parvum]SDG35709.1 4-alpha-glucanotransferase [Roseospirillum parvum]